MALFSIGGIASGLDTEMMIRQLMQLERQPVNRLTSRQADLRKADDAWGQINTKLSGIRSAVDKLTRVDRFDAFMKVSSSNTDAVGVEVSGTAQSGSLSFTVDQLARAQQSAAAGADGAITGRDHVIGAGTVSVTVDGTAHDVTLEDGATAGDLVDKLNGLKGGFTAQLVNVGDGQHELVVTSAKTGVANAATLDTSAHAAFDNARVVQEAADAKLSMGDLEITRSSNVIDDLIEGATITLKKTTTEAVTVESSRDVDAAAKAITELVDAVNGALSTIDKLSKWDIEAGSGGPLSGNATARRLADSLRSGLMNLGGGGMLPSDVGLERDRTGAITLDETKLKAALADNFEGVANLFARSVSTTADIGLISAGDAPTGDYIVNVTAEATIAQRVGEGYEPPNANRPQTLQITSGDKVAEVTITSDHATLADAVAAINAALEDAGITTVTARGEGGNLVVEGSRYGSAHGFELHNASDYLGNQVPVWMDTLVGGKGATVTASGTDVEGTITYGGTTYAATGTGRTLTGTEGVVDGMALSVRAGVGDHAFTYSRGIAGNLSLELARAEGTDGLVARARSSLSSQIKLFQDRIDAFETRLESRESTLRRQFVALERAMGQMLSQQEWLTGQLAGLNNNWQHNTK